MKEKKTEKQLKKRKLSPKKGENSPEKSEKCTEKAQKVMTNYFFAWKIQKYAHEYNGYLYNCKRCVMYQFCDTKSV